MRCLGHFDQYKISLWGTGLSMATGEISETGTSEYVQGVEVAIDNTGIIPDGFDVITLPATKYLMFQGEPFEEEDYCQAIETVQASMEKYDPSVIGYAWDNSKPHIQLEPRGERIH